MAARLFSGCSCQLEVGREPKLLDRCLASGKCGKARSEPLVFGAGIACIDLLNRGWLHARAMLWPITTSGLFSRLELAESARVVSCCRSVLVGEMAPHTRDRCCQSPCGQALRSRCFVEWADSLFVYKRGRESVLFHLACRIQQISRSRCPRRTRESMTRHGTLVV